MLVAEDYNSRAAVSMNTMREAEAEEIAFCQDSEYEAAGFTIVESENLHAYQGR